MVEADMGFYAIPDRALTERWVERTPRDFVFNVKAHALMTGHATDDRAAAASDSRRDSRRRRTSARIYAKDLPPELRDEVWRLFADAMQPLHDAGSSVRFCCSSRRGFVPTKHTPAMLARVREQLGELPVAVEFRHPSWLEPRLRERLWAQLREHGMTYVVADTPPGTPTSLPIGPGDHDARSGDRAAAWPPERALGRPRCDRSSRSIAISTTARSSRSG